MKITYNWLNDYCATKLPAPELAARLSLSGCLIEEQYPQPAGDTLFVLEITSNRPDLLGALGIAREAAALTGAPLRLPESVFTTIPERIESACALKVQAPDLCPRYTARLIRGVKIGPSPDWLRKRIEAIGLRVVNNVVDVTNYVMFECGQPLHAFDFDKLRGAKIIVRRAAEGETLVSIDGTECKLKPAMLVIADAEHPVAVAGIMGGLETEISGATVNVLLESAQFDPVNNRRTSRALALASDSSYRFERGIDPVQTEWAGRRAAFLIQQVAGGQVCEGVLDAWAKPYQPQEVPLRFGRLNKVLGTPVGPDVARAILERLGFTALSQSDPRRIVVQVPPWRAVDVTREIDLIEEVIRIYGYDKIPESGTLPVTVGRVSKFERVLEITRRTLVGLGFYDVVTSSFSEEAPAKLISPWTDAEPLTFNNTIRRDENRLRVSLLPGFLAVKRTNLSHGVAQSPLFEVNRVYLPKPPQNESGADYPVRVAAQSAAPVSGMNENDRGLDNPRHIPASTRDDRLPIERTCLTILDEEEFLHLKGALECLAEALGLAGRIHMEPASGAFWAEGMAARVLLDDKPLGVAGEVAQAICERYDMPHSARMAELNFDQLVEAAQLNRGYTKLPAFPAAVRDLAVVVDEAVAWAQIEGAVRGLNIPILEGLEFFDIFRGKQVPPGKKSIAFSLTFRASDRTLTSEEVEAARQSCIQSLAAVGAQLRG